ncbi:hypothetical protein ACFPH6_06865 [Streptomyces xiangluensis]|uniref:Uncharacterized protein n=1 Tax=Streptomyces xiangluensis TaxID=2665720 RepID=A0ABV8YK76_9ACTN
MLNRIRRAVSLTRERHRPKGRHRRPLTSSRPTAALAHPALTDRSMTAQGRHPDRADSRAGEDIALVRPYMLAWEKRVRQRSIVVARHLPAEAWSALAGVR